MCDYSWDTYESFYASYFVLKIWVWQLTIHEATTLDEKIASNQGWNEERTQWSKRREMHQVKEVDMLPAKIDLLMNKMDERDQQNKEVTCTSTIQA